MRFFGFVFVFKLKCLSLWLLLTFRNCGLLYHVTGKALETTSGLGPSPPVLLPHLASHQTGTRGQQAFLRLFLRSWHLMGIACQVMPRGLSSTSLPQAHGEGRSQGNISICLPFHQHGEEKVIVWGWLPVAIRF